MHPYRGSDAYSGDQHFYNEVRTRERQIYTLAAKNNVNVAGLGKPKDGKGYWYRGQFGRTPHYWHDRGWIENSRAVAQNEENPRLIDPEYLAWRAGKGAWMENFGGDITWDDI